MMIRKHESEGIDYKVYRKKLAMFLKYRNLSFLHLLVFF